METTESIWFNGRLVPWAECKVHFLAHALHYGSGVFEGIRYYETESGPAIFRLNEHIERLFFSAKALAMEIPFRVGEIVEACREVVKVNKINQGYIRPLAFYDYGVMGLRPTGAPVSVGIACWPWGRYLPHDMVDVKTSSYTRISPRSMRADAKISGNYINSILAVLELRGTKYHEALFLDDEGNIAEGPGENFFIVNGKLISTPPLGTILSGITRATVMEMARDLGYKVEERTIHPREVLACEEAFFTGTAAEVSPIKSLDDKIIGKGVIGPVTAKIKEEYLATVHGKREKYRKFLSVV